MIEEQVSFPVTNFQRVRSNAPALEREQGIDQAIRLQIQDIKIDRSGTTVFNPDNHLFTFGKCGGLCPLPCGRISLAVNQRYKSDLKMDAGIRHIQVSEVTVLYVLLQTVLKLFPLLSLPCDAAE